MNVQELIDALQEVEDKTQRVVVRGYEAGVDTVMFLEEARLELFENDGIGYYGQHETLSEYHDPQRLAEATNAIELVGGDEERPGE